ncbi:uncharacterized protein LOC123671293 [Harmonia axyridis]|uniref:uncharacterized protein LOC123671293 n=1 Tax=Harmonia axyridis TaxID=115357 RepID=UPI001E277DAA|nr:uncharacterized protein LOC123671293 [Harmonia axyridis]
MANKSVRETQISVIDEVVSSQPELGPKVPDGGYGWVVFGGTLFFQIFIPSLIVVYGILMASVKINKNVNDKDALYLWDDQLIFVPLLHIMGWTLFDPTARNLISRSHWPRLAGQAGNCFTCAGLLFVWMGMEGIINSSDRKLFLVFAGLLSGMGSSIQTAQCEILLAQYFKTKHLHLTHITHIVVALGFIFTPILVSNLRMRYDMLQVVLIYEAILLQGLLLNITFIKPEYLMKLVRYHYVTENPEDEEDIFSKSLTELKIKTENVLKRFELKNENVVATTSDASKSRRKDWVEFDDEDGTKQRKNWETFEKDEETQNNPTKYTVLEEEEQEGQPSSNVIGPAPLFNDVGNVNMNNSYAFDDATVEDGPKMYPTVFSNPQDTAGLDMAKYLKVLKMPTFYKSLLTIITTKYSLLVFYALFPSYLYVRIDDLKFRRSALIIGWLSIGALVFSGFSYRLNVTKEKRSIILFLLCWIGANGYFLIAMYSNIEYIMIFGALEVVLSIASLQHIGGPLLGLTIRGESNSEYFVLSLLAGLSFCLFLFLDMTYKRCFLLMSLLHIITGLLWVSNYFYKKIRL